MTLSEKSKILFVNKTSQHGGAEEALLTYMCAAKYSGYKPVLMVPCAGWLTDQCDKQNIKHLLLPSLPGREFRGAWKQFVPWLPNALRIARIIRKLEISIVHSNTPRVSYHAGLAARICRVPSIVHVHDIMDLPYASKPKNVLLSAISDYIIVVSDAVKKAILSYSPRVKTKIKRIYNNVDAKTYERVENMNLKKLYGFPDNSVILGNVSTMTPWKGQDILIKAFDKLHRDIPQARLLIVGSSHGGKWQDKHEENLHEQVANADLNNFVIFTGWKENVLPFVKSFDIFAHVPVRPDPLPTVLLHASALARPIVAADTGGIPEIVLNNSTGLLVPPGAVDDLYLALKQLISDELLRREFGQKAAERFNECFSGNQMRLDLANIYNTCLRSRIKRQNRRSD